MWFWKCNFQSCFTDWYLYIFYDNDLRWMPQNLTDDKSTLVQVMAWCSQVASHYLNQCWPRSATPYGVTRPQCVKVTLKWKGRQVNCPAHHWRHWRQASTSPVTTRAVNLMTFLFQWRKWMSNYIPQKTTGCNYLSMPNLGLLCWHKRPLDDESMSIILIKSFLVWLIAAEWCIYASVI